MLYYSSLILNGWRCVFPDGSFAWKHTHLDDVLRLWVLMSDDEKTEFLKKKEKSLNRVKCELNSATKLCRI